MRRLALLLAAFAMMLLAVGCNPPAKKIEVVTMVKATQDTSINASSDYRKLMSIGTMEKGKDAEVQGIYGDYVKVQSAKTNGWMWIELLNFNPGGAVKVGESYVVTGKVGASLLAGPSKNTKMVGAVTNGESVKILDVKVTWYKVTLQTENGDRTGWIYEKYVQPSVKTNIIK